MIEMKIGTIGSGVIVHSVMAAFVATEGISYEAVYSRSEKTGQELADAFGVRKIYTQLEDLLGDPEVNFIYIASPNSLHYSQAKMALEHGKSVICEKPLTPEKYMAEDLVKLAREKQLFLIDAVPTAYLPNFQLIREQLPKIGKVKLVMCNYSQYSSRYDKLLAGEIPNIFSLDYAAGSLQDINFYNVYFTVALFGKPEDAIYYPNRFDGKIDTSGIMILKYDGFVSSCAGAKDTWGVNFAQIEGEKGFIYVKDGSNGIVEVRVVTKTTDETFNEQPIADRFFYEALALPKLVNSGADAFASIQNTTIDVIEVMESARKKAGIYFTGEQKA